MLMFDQFQKYIFHKLLKKHISQENTSQDDSIHISPNVPSYQDYFQNFKQALGKSEDVVFREFELYFDQSIKVFICYISGMAEKDSVNQHIVKPLMGHVHIKASDSTFPSDLVDALKNHILSTADLTETDSIQDVFDAVLSGETAIFVDGYNRFLTANTRGYPSRGVTEPDTESVVRGPREGFNEVLRVNTSLIRRKIKNPNLIFEKFTLGEQTRTAVCIAYISGIANPKVIKEVKRRLERIRIDAVLESGYIEEYIRDNRYSLFSTIGNSEKPDIVAAKLLEGRIAIICDGTPFVLTVPQLFMENLQNAEDYYSLPFYPRQFDFCGFWPFLSHWRHPLYM
jgi:spore germination protein KA